MSRTVGRVGTVRRPAEVSMSRTKRNRKATMSAARAWQRTRQTAEQAKPATAQVKPLADSTRSAASRGLHRARAWAAPQVERTGHVLEDTIAPKLSALLTRSARRLEPIKPRRRRWPKMAGISAALVAGISAAAAALRNRKPPGDTTAEGQADQAGQAPSADADSKKPARTS